jgi:hypothetical protein
MRNYATVTLTVWSVLALAGCATTDSVLFVTKTSLGIDFDSKPATASIAYDRIEGYVAPRYDNGEIPPVVASVKSDSAIFTPNIRQVYATGDAAVIAVSAEPRKTLAALDPKVFSDTTDKEKGYVQKKLKGEKKLMFFGTTTTTGLKVGFTTNVPDSLVFGFKRKEYSFIPLGTQEEEIKKDKDGQPVKEKYDVYPSVLASIDTAATAGEADQKDKPTSLSNAQYFATGRAARELAANDAISKAFKAQAAESLRSQQAQVVSEENKLIKQIVAFFTADDGKTLKTDDLKKKVDELVGNGKIVDKSAGGMLEEKTKTPDDLKRALENNFDGLGKPLCDSLADKCK